MGWSKKQQVPQNPVGTSYPGRRRMAEAFNKGVYGRKGKCPFSHPKLVQLWVLGVEKANTGKK